MKRPSLSSSECHCVIAFRAAAQSSDRLPPVKAALILFCYTLNKLRNIAEKRKQFYRTQNIKYFDYRTGTVYRFYS